MAANLLNSNNEVTRKLAALAFNINAGKSLANILATNLGPRGTLKMLVSGGGDIKMTKDGQVLLKEMAIQHPTAALIARQATAQDDITGDGTTSVVLFIGELLKQSEQYLAEGLHPRILAEGFNWAKNHVVEWMKNTFTVKTDTLDHELLANIARTALRTKVHRELADKLTSIVVDSVLTIRREGQPIDLFMVETNLSMEHKSDMDTVLIKGIVMDHGTRHPDMPTHVKNAFILTCNVSLEYEKSEENSKVEWTDPAHREQMVEAERRFVDERVRKVIEFKRSVCTEPGQTFVILNQKGIDPLALDMLAKEGIMALRRAKRRNMERLVLACGGESVNSFDDLTPSILGYAGEVYEQTLGEEKYTFVTGVKNPFSCTILFKGPNRHTIKQTQDAVRDGLRAVKNTIEDGCVLPGGGAFELSAYTELMKVKDSAKLPSVEMKLAVEAFAKALLVIPKTLAMNSGFESLQTLLKLQSEHQQGHVVGLDLITGEAMDPTAEGVFDGVRVKRQLLESATLLTSQLLLVDEILKAGKAQQ
eukprot:TRINITY_DN14983_c0_g1_i1.p1 TRINITY_DN14983_c0_g1~~TRINITY_DN14983_c0_g1_i1.p1  ORF type:complete len:534 (-),score=160.51 TRINITY_DN14983_c0_g1_i1:34-1635(-)